MTLIRTQGHILQSALPQETVAANMTRRLLKIIREEFDVLQTKVRAITEFFLFSVVLFDSNVYELFASGSPFCR